MKAASMGSYRSNQRHRREGQANARITPRFIRAAHASRPVIALVLAIALGIAVSTSRANDNYEDDQVVVGLSAGVSVATINAHYGTYTLDHQTGTSDYLLGTAPGADIEALVALMMADPDLTYAETNTTSEAAEGVQGTIASVDRSATSTTFQTQPSAVAVQAAAAHALASGGGTLVAVVDNGVMPAHSELAGHLSAAGFDFVDGDAFPYETADGVDQDGDGLIDEGFGHGTHVSGLILLAAPGAVILPLRVLDDEGRGPSYRVAAAIRYATQQGARVINMSLSLRTRSSLVAEAINEAREDGITMIAGAGNTGLGSLDYPASDTDVIGIAATDENGVRAPFTSYGEAIAVSAPGREVLSSYGSSDYARWGGTSMACAFASGGAALLLGRYPDLSGPVVEQKLRQTATPIAAQNPGYSGLLGAGLVNLEGLASVPAPSVGSVKVRKQGGAVVSWQPVQAATAYDVIRGSLGNLSRSGSHVALGPVVCLANDTASLSTAASPDTGLPAPGSGYFYLMRPRDGSVQPDYDDPFRNLDRVPGPGDCPR